MSELSRREFLGKSAAYAGAGLAAGLAISAHVAESSENNKVDQPPVKIAVMGVNGRGRGVVSGFASIPNVEIAYICDPDADVVPKAMKLVEDRGKSTPKIEKDFRVALEDPEVTALACAAPDHWHALATILACQAGKDVYVEKPCSHNPIEGRKMVEAARKYNRVVQVGTQRRSGEDYHAAVKLIREGRLGKVHFARAWVTSVRPKIGHVEVSPAPANLDFNLWCGPAPDRGYKKNLVHYHWHWRWDYGTGECGNNGVHMLDIARWGLGVDYPETITCGGGKYYFDDDQETPDTQLATFDFPQAAIQWEHRTWSPRGIEGLGSGVTFYGTNATMVCKDRGWTIYEGNKEVESHPPFDFERPHLQNFLDCIVSRGRPNADIDPLHKSTLLCQLANISWRTRSTLKFDGKTESIVGNEEASALMGRTYRKGFELPSSV